MADPYYWHYRCPSTGLLTRVDLFIVADDKAEETKSGKTQAAKFPCHHCGKEHEGFLERSKFGK